MELLCGVLEHAVPGDFVVLVGDFSAHIGNDSETWRDMTRRNGLLVRFQVPSPETCADNDPHPFSHIGSCDKTHDQ